MIRKRILQVLKTLTMTMIRSDCFKRLAFSKTIWGLIIFLILGVYFTIQKLWSSESLDYFKWLGPFFFASRAIDNATNITLIKKDISE